MTNPNQWSLLGKLQGERGMQLWARVQLITVLLFAAVMASTSGCRGTLLPPDTPSGSRLNAEEPWLYHGAALTLHSVTAAPVEGELTLEYSVINVGREGIDFWLMPSDISVTDSCGHKYEVLGLQSAEPVETGIFLAPDSRLDFSAIVKAAAEAEDCTLFIDVYTGSFPTTPAWETMYGLDW